ncbi:MAG: sulfate ABC transporter substrate-binding protein, partial [Pseudomonadota bacterium]|nr:sulfate ABC transporter substrate-binding protein [Pseudomonadota bacterium]
MTTTPHLPARRWILALVMGALALPMAARAADTELLNVSYDVARELYKDVNPVFAAEWKQKTGETLVIKQSHGGSSKQARSVADGLEASVVTMNQANDIDMLADRGLVAKDWAKKFPNNAAPYYSTMVFLVRKGNPKQIKNWDDLAKPGVKVVIPNPKTAGNGRYTYLAAWGSVLKKGGTEAQARDLVGRIFKNVPVLDAGGRAATTTFTQREIGDALVTFENEVQLVRSEFGDNFEVVYPPTSILAESPVAVVDKVVDKRGVRKDRADVFATKSEGFRGQTAVDWKLVDASIPRSKFADAVRARALELAENSSRPSEATGITLSPLQREVSADASSIPLRVSFVNLQKLTLCACVADASIWMLAPAQKTLSIPPVTTT